MYLKIPYYELKRHFLGVRFIDRNLLKDERLWLISRSRYLHRIYLQASLKNIGLIYSHYPILFQLRLDRKTFPTAWGTTVKNAVVTIDEVAFR